MLWEGLRRYGFIYFECPGILITNIVELWAVKDHAIDIGQYTVSGKGWALVAIVLFLLLRIKSSFNLPIFVT